MPFSYLLNSSPLLNIDVASFSERDSSMTVVFGYLSSLIWRLASLSSFIGFKGTCSLDMDSFMKVLIELPMKNKGKFLLDSSISFFANLSTESTVFSKVSS